MKYKRIYNNNTLPDKIIKIKITNKTRLEVTTPNVLRIAANSVARLATIVSTHVPGGFHGNKLNVSWIPVCETSAWAKPIE